MIIIHHNDLDGRCSAAIVYRYLKKYNYNNEQIKLFEMDYETTFPIDKITKNEKVYILDFCLENDEINKVVDHFLGKNKYPKYFQTIKSKIDASDIEYIKLIVKSFYDKMIKFPKLLYNVSHIVEKVDNIYLSIIKSESLNSIHNTAKLSPDIEGSVCASQNNTTHDEDRFGDKYEYKSHSTSLSDYPKKRQSSSSSSRNFEDK